MNLSSGPGVPMKPGHVLAISFLVLLFAALANANDKQVPAQPSWLDKAPPITKQTRMDLIRAFNAELVYIRSPFPMGKTGLRLENGVITPDRQQLELMMASYGPAAKIGDMAMITNIVIKDRMIHFEINGGPVKKKKWYQRIEVGGAGGTTPIAPTDTRANPRGSFVDLVFDRPVPEMNPQQLKDLLRPVFDFNSKSAVEAYLDTVPPKVKEAIKNHNVLVGMNREMVIYAKGRPPKKDREKDGDTEYEEWIYGEPPADVDFIRFVGDQVVRVEIMKVGGQKIVRTEKEVDINPPATTAKEGEQPRPANAPTLRRPGEELPGSATPKTVPSGAAPPVAPPPPPSPSPGSSPSPN
ncbi:MAG TPA: hypothetical protein VEV41_14675 [Terriglobales bacterium]|jgi:hypothetical protein|nr:hypothetical protein [Terriglobales bacterium]